MQPQIYKKSFLLLFTAALFTTISFARLSLPNNFYYGEAKGIGGICLTGVPNVKVIAKLNGKTCAETSLGGFISNNVNYILRVPLDDGWENRFAEYAPRQGEFINAFIYYDGTEFPVEDYIPPVGPEESAFETDIQATPEPTLFLIFNLGFFIFGRKLIQKSPFEGGLRGM